MVVIAGVYQKEMGKDLRNFGHTIVYPLGDVHAVMETRENNGR